MLPPKMYEQARRNARLHLQIELDSTHQTIEEDCENFSIHGKIIRIFRGHRVCRIGESVNLDVAAKVSSILYCSGIIWLHYTDLLCSRHMEVYLDGKPPNCSVALYQYELTESLTKDPVLSCPPRKWWDKPLEVLQGLLFRVSYCIKYRIWLPKNFY